MRTSQPDEILPLTGVRFLAVTMIFLFHYAYRFSFAGPFATGILDQLFLGVQVFFVLSGFVICYKYFDNANLTKNFFFTYYIRRFAKIYPSFFLLTTLTFIFLYVKTDIDSSFWKTYFLNITFLKGLSARYYLSGIGPTWSLTVEEMFYLASPFIFLFFKKKKILLTQVAFWWIIGVMLVVIFSAFPFEGFFEDARFVFLVTFFGRCFEFYLGILLALYILGKYKWKKLVVPAFSFPFYTIAGMFGMAVVILLIYKVSLAYNMEASRIPAGIFLTNIVFPLSVVCFFLGVINETSVVQRLFSSSIFQLLGKSSYAFFLVHTGIVASGIEKYLTKNIFLLFVGLQLFSILLYKFFESPVNLWIRRKGKALFKDAN